MTDFDLEKGREALIRLLQKTDGTDKKAQFVGELMVEIKALRDVGVGFDEIASTLKEFVVLTAEDLADYYLEARHELILKNLHASMERYVAIYRRN